MDVRRWCRVAEPIDTFPPSFGVTSRIVPLDPVVTQTAIGASAARSFSVRLSRHVTPRFAIELGTDSRSSTLTDSALANIEATHESFQRVWTQIAPEGQSGFSNVSVDATASVSQPRETLVTGAVTWNVRPVGRLTPYLTGGIGLRYARYMWRTPDGVGTAHGLAGDHSAFGRLQRRSSCTSGRCKRKSRWASSLGFETPTFRIRGGRSEAKTLTSLRI